MVTRLQTWLRWGPGSKTNEWAHGTCRRGNGSLLLPHKTPHKTRTKTTRKNFAQDSISYQDTQDVQRISSLHYNNQTTYKNNDAVRSGQLQLRAETSAFFPFPKNDRATHWLIDWFDVYICLLIIVIVLRFQMFLEGTSVLRDDCGSCISDWVSQSTF